MAPVTFSPQGRQRLVNRVKRQLAASAAARAGADDDEDADDLIYVPPIAPGQIKLYSYFVPGLTEGRHTIDVEQNIAAPHASTDPAVPVQNLTLTTHQEFEVYGPRYSLPANTVHQTYPPQGHADYGNILPHIVFEDPHLPWENEVTSKDASPFSTPPPRNSTPWLALLVFTEDELRLSAAELATASKGGLFPDSPFSTAFPDLAGTQSKTTMTVTLLARQAAMLDTWKPGTGTPPATRKIVTGIIRSVDDDPNDPLIPNPDDGTKPTDPATLDMVFVPTDVFSALFCSYGDNGMRQTPAGGVPDLSRYKYLAHARQVNTVQMADNGAQNGTQAGTQDEQGLFSIIVSHRTGPLPGIPRLIPIPQTDFSTTPGPRPAVVLPHSVIVHLVSLEGIENYIRLPITESRVGLVSLYSWTYTCLPPESVNFVDSMRAIGFQVLTPDYALRPPTALLNNLPAATTNGAADVIGQRLRQRANDGFAFIRHLTSTGEETSAFFRGALTPNLPQVPLDANWPAQVNNSSGLDILDPVLGIMDITYSSAWELGRTLAVADKSFTAALSRVRRATQKQAADATKAALLAPLFRTKIDILTRLPSTVSFVSSLVKKMQSGTVSPSPPSSPPSQPPNPASGASLQAFKTNVRTTLKALGSAAAPSGTSDPDPAPYNEYNVPQNSDWALVLKWILDRMFLYNIPPNYLITDPSHLPTETIRFFYIDPNWMNALIDGALSIGNHLDEADDIVRAVMKNQLNDYFKSSIDSQLNPNRPQIPCWGFFLRSAVVKAFPNLQVHAPWPAPAASTTVETRIEILRNEVVDKDILLVLLDRLPGAKDLSEITISQPSHQQRYAVGTSYGPDATGVETLEFQFKRVYTNTPADPEWSESLDLRMWKEGKGEVVTNPLPKPNPSVIFDFDSNCMIPEAFAETCTNVLTQELGTGFTDPDPSSALVGIQLNDPIQKMILYCPQDSAGSVPSQDTNVYSIPLPNISDPPANPDTPPNMRIDLPHIATPHKAGTISVSPNPPPAAAPTTAPPVPSPTPSPIIGGFKNGFNVDAFIAGQKGNHTLPMAPSTSPNNLPVDLVIALNHNTLQDQTLYIWRVQVLLPKGPAAKHLLQSYDGGGARMLSNQRFNVHGEASQNYYNLYLIPRSTSQLVQVGKVQECSFICNGIVLNGVPGPVAVQILTSYKAPGPPGSDSTKWPDTGTSSQTVVLNKVAVAG